eukprot:jgi/Botrbrau1/13847/Bobra.0056s0084.1
MGNSATFTSRVVRPFLSCLKSKLNTQKMVLPTIRAMGHGSHASDNDPEVLQREQERNLKGETKSTIPHAPGWNEKLASDSEAAVKAEQEPQLSIQELQFQTIKDLTDPDCPAGDMVDYRVKAEQDNRSIEQLQRETVDHVQTEHLAKGDSINQPANVSVDNVNHGNKGSHPL